MAVASHREARYTGADAGAERLPPEAFMNGSRLLRVCGVIAALIVLARPAAAGTRTYVALAGRDDGLPRLGRPGIRVQVDGSSPTNAAFLTSELARVLAQQVHTRGLETGEPGDYDLEITLEAPRVEDSVTMLPFEARLRSAQGERLWRIEGRSDVVGAPLDASVFAGIGRNVVSALIHDGWVQPRYDPDNPPPQPPSVRNENGPR